MCPRPGVEVTLDADAGDVAPFHDDRTAVHVRQPGHRVDQLGLAVPVDAGDPDDLPGAHLERDAAHLLDPAVVEDAQAVDAEQRLSGVGGVLSDAQQDVAADHQPRQALLRRARRRRASRSACPAAGR